MTLGQILGTAVAGSSVLSLAGLGILWAYEKIATRLTPEPAVELPKLTLPPEDGDEER